MVINCGVLGIVHDERLDKIIITFWDKNLNIFYPLTFDKNMNYLR